MQPLYDFLGEVGHAYCITACYSNIAPKDGSSKGCCTDHQDWPLIQVELAMRNIWLHADSWLMHFESIVL